MAGPEYICASNGLPNTALMAFDSADAAALYIDLDGNYVSDMTIASLEDLGYETIYDDGIVIA